MERKPEGTNRIFKVKRIPYLLQQSQKETTKLMEIAKETMKRQFDKKR